MLLVADDEATQRAHAHWRRVEDWLAERVRLAARPGERGVGDTVERLLRAVGVHQVVKHAAATLHASCGCADRREALNRRFPYLWPENEAQASP